MEEQYAPITLDKNWIAEQLASDKTLAAEYEEKKTEYSLLDELIRARTDAGLSQKALAERIGKQQAAIGRLESTLAKPEGSVNLASLREYAVACGKKLDIRLVDI